MRHWRVLNSSVVSFWLKLERSPPFQKRSAIVEELSGGVFLSKYQVLIECDPEIAQREPRPITRDHSPNAACRLLIRPNFHR